MERDNVVSSDCSRYWPRHRADKKILYHPIYSNAFIILVKGVVYDAFVTNHSV